ncbi:unnamed protein product [Ilex paraguariensis]|uniref:GTD-binding domain-containing protein n=1 Tax=Ilex paraguariensis TaxID=185542 RepID=A0ABC8RZE1_9AQUA
MAVSRISSVNRQRNPRKFMSLLSSAACEWLLIFLLFVDAAFSYLLTTFASYCELQTPCLLCSRLDHVFGNKNPGFYRNLFCSNHKTEISTLISCHLHGKLANVVEMCEECLVSFVMQNKSNPESYRLLVGKLGLDFERCGFESPFLKKNFTAGSLSKRNCSCCDKPWRTRSNAQGLLQLTPVGFGASKAIVKPPLPRLPGRSRLTRRDSLRRIREKFSGPLTPHCSGNTGVDSLSHVGYTELKITSDSESEVPFSDDDGSSVVREEFGHKEDLVVQPGPGSLSEARTEYVAPVKQAHQASNSGPSLLDLSVPIDASEPNHVNPLTSNVIGHGLGELNWEHPIPNPNSSALPELIWLDDVPPSSNTLGAPFGVLAEGSKHDIPLSHMSRLSALSELVSLYHVTPSSNGVELPLGISPQTGTSDIELPSTTTKIGADFSNDATPSMPDIHTTDVSKSAINHKTRNVRSLLADQLTVSDADEGEDLKFLPHTLNPNDMDSLLNNTSPRTYGHQDGLQKSDVSNSDGIQVLQRFTLSERNDSDCESVDGNSVCEIKGESVVDRLQRQVEHDRRCMRALYKELEEERSAAAVAANQAMAMITRLQEEKAVLHMESLQYLRMMEEQAEYDMEALEKANDLLGEKEKEMQDLEAELEFYRITFSHESAMETLHEETSNSRRENVTVETNGVHCNDNKGNIPCGSRSSKISEGSHKPINGKTSLLDFGDEKLYISQCLKKLERSLHQVSSNGESSDMPNGGYSEKMTDAVDNQGEFPIDKGTQINHQKKENGVSLQKAFSASNGNPSAKDSSVASVEDNHFVIEKNYLDSDRQTSFEHFGKLDLTAIENEILDLHDRLEAVEADRDFLEHAFNSLQNGNEGIQFIKEVAHQLQELRKFEFRRKCVSAL